MPKFTDKGRREQPDQEDRIDPRTWIVDLDVAAVQRVQAQTGVNLLAMQEGQASLFEQLRNPAQLVGVLFAVCEPQASHWNIPAEEFAHRMAGDSIEQAGDALMDALVSFSPSPRDRKNLGLAIEKSRKATSQVRDLIDQHLAGGAIDREINAAIEQARRELAIAETPGG